MRSLNINLRSLAVATGIGILVQIGLVIISESITVYINSSANQSDWNLKLIFNECCWPYFTPAIDVFIGTLYPFVDNRKHQLTKRNGIAGGAIAVLFSSLVGFALLMISRWLIIPQLTGVPVDFEVWLEGRRRSFEFVGVGYGIIYAVGYFAIFKPLTKLILGGVGGLIGVGLVNRKPNEISAERTKLMSNPTTRRIIFGIIGLLIVIALCGTMLVVGLYEIIGKPSPAPPCYPSCAGVDFTDPMNFSEGDPTGGFFRANLVSGDFSRANLFAMTLYGANLENANLTEANLRWSDLINANLAGANLTKADLIGASLRSADLNNANLTGAVLRATKMQEVNLSGANLSEADLRKDKYYNKDGEFVRYVEVDLWGGNLSGADLRGADLSGAILVNIDFQGAKYNDATIWPEDFDPVKAGAIYEN